MPFVSFDAYPLWLNALIFLLSAGTIWFAGVRLERNGAWMAMFLLRAVDVCANSETLEARRRGAS